MAPRPPPPSVRLISDCFIKPHRLPVPLNSHLHLQPWDLAMLPIHYIQWGLLFPLPPRCLDPCNVMMWSSPRFNMYGNEFGLGKAVALRSGYGNKFDGKVSGYPGRDGEGSIDLEICLSPEKMAVLEADAEFMTDVTVS